jgi:pimeloyl-ACP methyl ester carboxylesterase
MGVDARLFKNIKPEGCRIHHIKWLTPLPDESLSSYASRLSEQIDTSQPFALIGVSFGGMNCVEIAKKLNPVKTFIISSCKQSSELPLKITFWRGFSLYRKLSDELYVKGAMIVKKQFGVQSKEQQSKFLEMLKSAPEHYFSGAVHCIMTWRNTIVPPSLIHIHGTKDRVLPLRKIIPHYKIKGGTHFMVVDKAEEINRIIQEELKKSGY